MPIGPPGYTRPVKVGFVAVLVLGAVVWVFALIGVVSVARALGPFEAPRPAALLATSVDGTEIPDLPAYPGATRSEFREEVFVDERITEIEYAVDSSVHEVRGHYRDALVRGGWTVTAATWLRGEWVYSVSSGARSGVVEIERRDGVTEVEVEMSEPITTRGGLTDR